MQIIEELEPSNCRKCGTVISMASAFAQRFPQPGDTTICVECGALSVFDENKRLAEPTPEQLEYIKNDPKLYNAIVQVRRMIHARKSAKNN